jgi:hypothetical protein
VILAVAGVLLVSQVLVPPHEVARLRVENPTGYSLLVEVTDGHGHGWMPLGTIDPRAPTSFERVHDVGDVWQFRAWTQARIAGTFRVSRAQLDHDGWRVTVPQRLEASLRARSVPPTA